MTDADTIAAQIADPNEALFQRLCDYVDAGLQDLMTGNTAPGMFRTPLRALVVRQAKRLSARVAAGETGLSMRIAEVGAQIDAIDRAEADHQASCAMLDKLLAEMTAESNARWREEFGPR